MKWNWRLRFRYSRRWPGAVSFRIWPHNLRISSISSPVSLGMAIVNASRSSISRQW